MAKKNYSYNNLIDYCIELESETTNVETNIVNILTGYFFKKEIELQKKLEHAFTNLKFPTSITDNPSILKIDLELLRSFVAGSTINDSLCGKIMLSETYLKNFYSNHPPSFSKLPDDVQQELIGIIKDKNEIIMDAFEKITKDIDANNNRKIIKLIALILKNIHRKTNRPINNLDQTIPELINSIYQHTDEIFDASQKQISELKDDSKIKNLVKSIFIVKQFKEISDIADEYKLELNRYILRTQRIQDLS